MHYRKNKNKNPCHQLDSPIVQDLLCFVYTYTGCGTQATEYYLSLCPKIYYTYYKPHHFQQSVKVRQLFLSERWGKHFLFLFILFYFIRQLFNPCTCLRVSGSYQTCSSAGFLFTWSLAKHFYLHSNKKKMYCVSLLTAVLVLGD